MGIASLKISPGSLILEDTANPRIVIAQKHTFIGLCGCGNASF